MTLRRLIPGLLMGALVMPQLAWAHARLVKATPADGAALSQAPTAVVLAFNEAPELEFSKVSVLGPQDKVLLEQIPLQGGDRNSLKIPLPPPLAAGTYTVKYRILSVDGHLVEGKTTFSLTPTSP